MEQKYREAVEIWQGWEVAKACVEKLLAGEPDEGYNCLIYNAVYRILRLEERYFVITENELVCQVRYWLEKAAANFCRKPETYRSFVRRVVFCLSYLHRYPRNSSTDLAKQEVIALAHSIWRREIERHIRLRLMSSVLPMETAEICLELAEPRPAPVPSTQIWSPQVPAKRW